MARSCWQPQGTVRPSLALLLLVALAALAPIPLRRKYGSAVGVSAFLFGGRPPVARRRWWGAGAEGLPRKMASADTVGNEDPPSGNAASNASSPTVIGVRTYLKFIGPYPTMSLRFPGLAANATSSMRTLQGEDGAASLRLDFVLDTGANTNTISSVLAEELGLEQVAAVSPLLPALGASGRLRRGGDIYLLGDAELYDLPDSGTFVRELWAAAVAPVASPVPGTAGLLSTAFFGMFDGVEFDWDDSNEEEPPTIAFYLAVTDDALANGTRVPIARDLLAQIPTLAVEVNGVPLVAVLDTGSPITLLNTESAKRAGVTIPDRERGEPDNPSANNRTDSRGGVLKIFGAGGSFADLVKGAEPANFAVSGLSKDDEKQMLDFGGGHHVYVGDLPMFTALRELGVESPPAVVLGMDILRQRPKMLLQAQKNLLWFY